MCVVKILQPRDIKKIAKNSLFRLKGMASPRVVCSHVLVGLEADILEYIIEMLDSSDADVTVKDSIIGFLVGAEFSASEEEAAASCADIFAQLGLVTPTLDAVLAEADAPTALLDKPKSLASDAIELPQPPKKGRGTNYNSVIPTLVPTTFEPKAVKLRNKQRKVPKAEEELEQEIETAMMLAAKTRSQQGAYNGAIEATDFTLPNPGGGMPLLEKASMCLVRGSRYGLIGRNGKGPFAIFLFKSIA